MKRDMTTLKNQEKQQLHCNYKILATLSFFSF